MIKNECIAAIEMMRVLVCCSFLFSFFLFSFFFFLFMNAVDCPSREKGGLRASLFLFLFLVLFISYSISFFPSLADEGARAFLFLFLFNI